MSAVRLASMEVSLGRLRGVARCDKLLPVIMARRIRRALIAADQLAVVGFKGVRPGESLTRLHN
jgi:hypothetical protein